MNKKVAMRKVILFYFFFLAGRFFLPVVFLAGVLTTAFFPEEPIEALLRLGSVFFSLVVDSVLDFFSEVESDLLSDFVSVESLPLSFFSEVLSELPTEADFLSVSLFL